MANCTPFNDCFEFTNEKVKIVSFNDPGSKVSYFYNNTGMDALSKYRVDGCLISDNGAKCDYLLLNCTKNISYFIELKGSDLERAIEQIDRSLDILLNKMENFSAEGRIVLSKSRSPNLKSSKQIKLEKKFRKLRGELKIRTRKMTEEN